MTNVSISGLICVTSTLIYHYYQFRMSYQILCCATICFFATAHFIPLFVHIHFIFKFNGNTCFHHTIVIMLIHVSKVVVCAPSVPLHIDDSSVLTTYQMLISVNESIIPSKADNVLSITMILFVENA